MNETTDAAPSTRHLDLAEVPRLERPEPSLFEELYVRASRPVIVTGALEHWPAREKWSAAWFRERLGDRRVKAYAMDRGHIRLNPRRGFVVVPMSVREYVDSITSTAEPEHYLRTELGDNLTELLADTDVPAYCAGGRLLRSNLWFAGAGTVSRLHVDVPENLMCQIVGRKRYLLFPWQERRRFYRRSLFSPQRFISPVDPERPDFERYPLLRGARGCQCVLQPGEMLFIPALWWHYGFAPELSISVNFWWGNRSTWPLLALSVLYTRLKRHLAVDV